METVKKAKSLDQKKDFILLRSKSDKNLNEYLSENEQKFLQKELKSARTSIVIQRPDSRVWIIEAIENEVEYIQHEKYRKIGNTLLRSLNHLKLSSVQIFAPSLKQSFVLAFVEGLLLGNYQFLKYFSDRKERANTLQKVNVIHAEISSGDLREVINTCAATKEARDLVNEPVSFLTATEIANQAEKLGKEYGFEVEVFKKKKIEALKMGGLLAVNQGSVDPPSFSILEWKPNNAKNKKPVILVGKGVVYDTGGLSLKPTKGSMDEMKADMGGAAAVIGALCAVSSNKLPVHVIGLVPATDNRPGLNAYAPGDVVKMHNGMTVEVLNTDAEGRMLLADALSYAKNYKPELVIDLATLTGAAHRAVGTHASVIMGNAPQSTFEILETAGERTYERTVEFPFWEEYGDMLKSTIADVKNIGGALAGAITAGKFLEHFTKDKGKSSYDWIHMDIAGPAFLNSRDHYRTVGGTGVGVRLLYEFIKTTYSK
ncbi:MAG: leucyl aminopeptidase [Flavobacteriales bacterium]|nr:leucyl aminopeptidase [Flavobacteriales bacterium]